MKHHSRSMAIAAVCLAVVLAAMAWVSVVAVRLDRAEARGRRQAALEENVRLALWRMDSAASQLVARESSRPYYAYSPFYATDRAYSLIFEPRPVDVLVPSALLFEPRDLVRVHFEFAKDGSIRSPQVPCGAMEALARRLGIDLARREGDAIALEGVRAGVRPAALAGALRDVVQWPPTLEAPAGGSPALVAAARQKPEPATRPSPAATPRDDEPAYQQAQVVRNEAEWNARYQMSQQMNVPPGPLGADSATQAAPSKTAPSPGAATVKAPAQAPAGRNQTDLPRPLPEPVADRVVSSMAPVWIGDMLILARLVKTSGPEQIQGCWIEWPTLRESLLRQVRDLLPRARLEPAAERGPADQGRMLATLPVRLVPGPGAPGTESGPTPIRFSLVVAWASMLLAGAAAFLLYVAAVNLSERRAAFVSAVTHELRTPLTTFRMYAEMLSEGMVPGEADKKEYLATLRRESERLSHLVENVLAYARLERGRSPARLEAVSVRELLERAIERLRAHALASGKLLADEIPDEIGGTAVQTDPSVVEQILFNLVDNACKYSAGAEDRRVHLEAERRGRTVLLRVRDHGPGVDRQVRSRLFQPFTKSAADAARTAPGVGLGLALSRRLARQMRCDLRFEPNVRDGASFALVLPVARPRAA